MTSQQADWRIGFLARVSKIKRNVFFLAYSGLPKHAVVLENALPEFM